MSILQATADAAATPETREHVTGAQPGGRQRTREANGWRC
ncbi:hypothetical protein C9F11_47140 (plasmid) [Streptomyces sp. YIM 121038]|nr:hypothetical protein C9F11_00040 [Streptomyces sp. YIM 121038]QCX82108.1 hypothetical protein C9F11_42640 [Streptomyces sp. YIM 121038]QCX82123.1 hypothetical protein C9F11_42715 [Streptomyces sp. YIM 121038]QCX82975.1 hypothetical protein C9F11_47140 [Streptomyces sp. YIM 121038]